MPSSSGRDLRAAKYRADLSLDALFAPAAVALGESVRRYAVETPDGPRITEAARRAILADLNGILGPLYGRRRGDPGAVGRLAVRQAKSTYAGVLGATADEMRERLVDEPALIERISG
jgi:hypothetical protein